MKKVFLTVILLSLCCSCTLLLNDNSGTISLALPHSQLNRALPTDTKNNVNSPDNYTVKLTAERGSYKLVKTFLPEKPIEINNIPIGNYELIVYGDNEEFEFEGKETITIEQNKVTQVNMTIQKYKKYLDSLNLDLNGTYTSNPDPLNCRIYNINTPNTFDDFDINQKAMDNQNQIYLDYRFRVGQTYVFEITEGTGDYKRLKGMETFYINRNQEKIIVPLNRDYSVYTGGSEDPATRTYTSISSALAAIQARSVTDSTKAYNIIVTSNFAGSDESTLTINTPIKLIINSDSGNRATINTAQTTTLVINHPNAEVNINNINIATSSVADDIIKVVSGRLSVSKCQLGGKPIGAPIYDFNVGTNGQLLLGNDLDNIDKLYIENTITIQNDFNYTGTKMAVDVAPSFDLSKPIVKRLDEASLDPLQTGGFDVQGYVLLDSGYVSNEQVGVRYKTYTPMEIRIWPPSATSYEQCINVTFSEQEDWIREPSGAIMKFEVGSNYQFEETDGGDLNNRFTTSKTITLQNNIIEITNPNIL